MDKQSQKRSKNVSVRSMLFDNLLTIEELADDLSYAKNTIYNWVRQGLPKRKIRGKLYFEPSQVAQWMQRTTRR